MDIRGTIKSYATRYYMVLKQRERVCEAARAVVDFEDWGEGSVTEYQDVLNNLKKEVRKLRALEGD